MVIILKKLRKIINKKIRTLVTFTILSFSYSIYAYDKIVSKDEYIKGYVQSIFVNSYGLPKNAITVKKGIIIIDSEKIDGNLPEQIFAKITEVSKDLGGIHGVEWKNKHLNDLPSSPKIADKTINNQDSEKFVDIAMPNRSLFEPLIADPKWPRFTLAYQYYFNKGTLKHGFAPNFGASFPLYRIVSKANNSQWELGVQGGLFALMNIGASPTALVNADYFISLPLTYRLGAWSALVRLYHVSSHLGDEYMLTPEGKKTNRINLSYEGIDALLSYNFNNFRLYGGGGYIINRDPSYIKRLKVQGGAEYYSPSTFMNGKLRPVIGIDVKADQNWTWHPGISCKAGVQFENSTLVSNKVQLMLEYYSGKSIHGQFYNDKVKYIGIGLQAFL